MHLPSRLVLPCVFAVVVAACGGSADESSEAAAGDGAATQESAAGGEAVTFSVADLDAFQRGFAREIELVKAADAAGDTASTPESRGAAMQAKYETSTMPEGAKVSGLGDRYEPMREVVLRTLRTLDMQGRIEGPVSLDTARASAESKARLASDPIAELPAEAAAAMRARLDALAVQWAQYIRLTAVAG